MEADLNPQPLPPMREIRGSQKLLLGLARNGEVPSSDEITEALGLKSLDGLLIQNWQTRGIPPIYLEFDATFQVPIEGLNDLMTSFIQLNDSAILFNVHIRGIPPVVDSATVTVSNTGR
jgi:hypothetical protein